MYFDVNKNNLNETFFVKKKFFESPIENVDNIIDFSNSDSNYVSENSTIDLNKSWTIDEGDIDKSLIDFRETNSNAEDWLYDNFRHSEIGDVLLNFNFSTMKIGFKINDEKNLLDKLLINLSFKDNFLIDDDKKSFHDRFSNKMRLATSTPISKKFTLNERNVLNYGRSDISGVLATNITVNIGPSKDSFTKNLCSLRNDKCDYNTRDCRTAISSNNETFVNDLSSNNDYYSAFSKTDKVLSGNNSNKNTSFNNTISKPTIDNGNDQTVVYTPQRTFLSTLSPIQVNDDGLLSDNNIVFKPSLSIDSLEDNVIYERQHTFIKEDISSLNSVKISGSESPSYDNTIVEEMSRDDTDSIVHCSSSITPPSDDYVITKRSSTLVKPQSRLSRIRQTFPRPSVITSSSTELNSKHTFPNPTLNVGKSVYQSLVENSQNKRHSVIVRPKKTPSSQSNFVRQSIAVIPSSNTLQCETMHSNPAPPSLSKFSLEMATPLTSVTNDLSKPIKSEHAKTIQRFKAPSKIFKKGIVSSTDKTATTIKEVTIPQNTIQRPSQLKYNKFLKLPSHSESVPLISPMSNIDENPLNRTFDKQDFLLLKSVTNTNNDITQSTMLDTRNNNDTAYSKSQSAKGQNAMKDVLTQSAVPRGIKVPSKIQSRAIPSLKR